jgi:N-acetyl-gamma-glutamyl-phosphate reductase
MIKKLQVAIIGGAGYTGGELIRLLLNHAKCTIAYVHSRSNAGVPLHHVHKDLIGETDLKFTNETNWLQSGSIDVVFLCLGHGESKKFLAENIVPTSIKIIDLANDFRLEKDALYTDSKFIYGLPELNKAAIKTAHYIANPGCFATAIQLGLLPLANKNLLNAVYSTGITGSTGAGQSLTDTSHFSFRANNIQAYKTLTHQHIAEIEQSLQQLQPTKPQVNFVPWRGNFTRGIFVSSQLQLNIDIQELQELFTSYYQDAPFVCISYEPIALKQVVNTNKCLIHIEKVNQQVVIHAAIDNLIKGAVGQALQNLNIMFGFEETEGLKLKSIAF